MKILINYANWASHSARHYNTVTGMHVAGADRVIEYSPNDVDREYRRRNRKMFRRTIGAGYWLWKPWVIAETLKRIKEDDILIYSDAGIIFLQPIEPLIQRMEETGQDVMAFFNWDLDHHKESRFTKRDAFILLDCDSPEYVESVQCTASIHLWKKTGFSMEFARQWLHHVQDERLVSGRPNQLGLPNYPDFCAHRHDQSVFSLLAKKRGLILHRSPEAERDPRNARCFPDDRYPQMILNLRRKLRATQMLRDGLLPCWAAHVRSPYDGLRALGALCWPRNFLPILRGSVRNRTR